MILTPSQNKIAEDTHRFRVVNCGRRFGKTTLAVEEIKGKAFFKPSRIAYIAPTYQQARDIAWELLKKEFMPIANVINESRLELRVKTKDNKESIIILRGWESIETLRGQQFDFIVIDEIASMRNFWTAWNEVVRPTLTDTRGHALFISTPKGFNHFYDLYNFQDKDDDYKSFHFTTYDNTHIPSEEVDKAKIELPEDKFYQEYMADFRKMTGLVYKDFDRKRHVFSDPIQLEHAKLTSVTRLVGIDWGYTNPATVLLVLKDSDANYWVIDEFYKTQQTTAQIVEFAIAKRGHSYYPDPAEPDRNEELRRAGANVREVSKDVEAGIDAVRELLKANRVHIWHECVNLISEFETYQYPEKKPDKGEPEVPIKENDHALDNLRYILYMQGSATNGRAKQFIPNMRRR
jgi:PBSX family phage terminase large subunit